MNADDFTDFLRADARLGMLRLLSELPGMTSNSSILASLMDSLGHDMSLEQIKTDLAWLAERGLVTLEWFGDVLSVDLTDRGQDVAAGRTRVAGVRVPRKRR